MPADDTSTKQPRIVVASKSVKGYSHLASGKVCQDSSFALSGSEGDWRLAIVSDGHGDSDCPRSDRGSRFATQVVTQSFSEFAQAAAEPDNAGITLADSLRLETREATVVRRLTDSILARWRAAVHDDLQEHPLTEEELAQVSDRNRERYLRGERLEHAYGATLVCALWLTKVLLLLQQGDGLCLVIGSDGSVSQPIPEDERCFANVTTSLCDVDAADGIRHAIVDLSEQSAAAVVLGSDGVDNSFASEGDLESYAKELLTNIAQDGDAARLEDELAQDLPELSRRGSGDDMSVALMADVEAIRLLGDSFEASIERQDLMSQISACQTKLTSMERKHSILEQRRNDALAERARLEDELQAGSDRLDAVQVALQDMERRLDEYAAQREKLARIVNARRAALNEAPPTRPVIRFGSFEVRFIEPANRSLAKQERKLAEVMMAYDEACDRYDAILDDARAVVGDLERTKNALDSFDDTPMREFDEYHAQYASIQDELARCQTRLAALGNEGEG